ncbi:MULTISPECIES: SulP family inorganic anion transporter [Acidiphilium]|uniref:Sulfate permease, SulP family n=1 Tax=Acidiphilium rubrum TaxID=526 RepID=A0A8G2FCV0_ACIRU|nr:MULTISPECIES: SulP family inorganic anion transporter [Acidiphilium]SIQ53899.1 sulfate permease, SulP family [Acidiphilium rubrum]
MSLSRIRTEWFGNVRGDLLAGMVVALALIPEAIAFSIIAGVSPVVGLDASFCIAIVIAFAGGRPGMISAATGSVALLMVLLVRHYGVQYLFAATILTGIFQIAFGMMRLAVLMRFVSRSVITGFENALGILIFMAQLPQLINVTWQTYAMVAVGLVILYGLPRFTRVVPSPLVAILVLTLAAVFFHIPVRTVGDMGQLPDGLPHLLIPNVPFTWHTLMIVLPFSVSMALVGILESMMTTSIVDDLTDTPSNRNRENMGLGLANIVTGFLGGMAGCAMIGQSVINIKSGGRGRLSTLFAGVFLLILIVVLGPWLRVIPMAALVAVMIMVSIGTFNWRSLRNLRTYPKSSSVVMLATVGIVVATNNLAAGVGAGVVLSAVFFAFKVAQLVRIDGELAEDGTLRVYRVTGQVFFASTVTFANAFDLKEAVERVRIDLTHAHFWDISAVESLDKVVLKLRRNGTMVEVIGLNEASATIVDRLAVHDKPDALALLDHG